MIEKKLTYIPDLAVHPGVTLRENMEYLTISNKELSLRTGITEKHLSQIVNEEASLTADTAIKLEKAMGISADFWNNLQANYDIILSKIKAQEDLKKEINLVGQYNYSELAQYGLVKKTRDAIERVSELQNYFQVSSLLYVPKIGSIAFRNNSGSVKPESLLTWLRFGEIKAKDLIMTVPFDEKKLRSSLVEMKKLINKKDFFKDLQKLCADSGVILVHTPYFKNIKINGAVRWYKDNPLIQINSKGSYCDIFWFTFFHEVGHIVLHGKKDQFLDYDGLVKNEKEKEADEFASELLVPKNEYSKLVSRSNISLNDLLIFCKKLDINISVLIGRFAHDGLLSWSQASRFREKVTLSS